MARSRAAAESATASRRLPIAAGQGCERTGERSNLLGYAQLMIEVLLRRKTIVRWVLLQGLLAAALVAPAAAASPRPIASFSYSPAAPQAGGAVAFDASTSRDPDGPIVSYRWDFGDGSVQTYSSPLATHTYLLPGAYTVTLKVTGNGGPNDTGTASRTLTVSAVPPGAPPPPLSPRPVCSDGIDNDGDALVDFGTDPGCSSPDDNNEFNPPPPGAPAVADCADGIDNDGDGRIDFPRDPGCISASDPGEPDLLAAAPAPALLTPFPIVRIVGSSRGSGAKIRLLAVRAPAGSTIELRCRGRGCPISRQTKQASVSRRVRFPRFQRYLGAGVALGIYVGKPGFIGKYTRFRIRNRKRPARVDRCLLPRTPRPAPCPTGPAGG